MPSVSIQHRDRQLSVCHCASALGCLCLRLTESLCESDEDYWVFFLLRFNLIDVSSGRRANVALQLPPPALWSVCVCVCVWLVISFVRRPAQLCACTLCPHARMACAVCVCAFAVYVVAELWPILCTVVGCSVSVALLISMLELSAVSTPSTTLITDSL